MIFSILVQIISVLLLVLVLGYIIKTRHQRVKDYHDIDELRRDLRALTTAALAVGERVLKVERQQNYYTQEKPQMDVIPINNDPSYEHAIRLVQNGATINDLVLVCGLSQGEAELVSLMHKIEKVG